MLYRPGGSGDTRGVHTMSTNATTLRTTDDVTKVRSYIKKQIDSKYGTMTAYANAEKVSLQYVSNVMAGNKPIPDWMLKRFKIKHVVVESWQRAA